MGRVLSISSSTTDMGGGYALLASTDSWGEIMEDNDAQRIFIQYTPFIKSSTQSIISTNNISAEDSDYDIMLYLINDNEYTDIYIAPTKEILNKKIYVNEIKSHYLITSYANSCRVYGTNILDFSKIKYANCGIINLQGEEPDGVVVDDLYINFETLETVDDSGALFIGISSFKSLKIIIPSTLQYWYSSLGLFLHIDGDIVIVDAGPEIIKNSFQTTSTGKSYFFDSCTGTSVSIDYTAGHEDGAQALLDFIYTGFDQRQYSGTITIGKEVTI